jgi:hypothetical protein
MFGEVIGGGLIQAGKLESELTAEIHALARTRSGLRCHWHKRIARSGPNTLLTYHDNAADRRITSDDIVYLDFGLFSRSGKRILDGPTHLVLTPQNIGWSRTSQRNSNEGKSCFIGRQIWRPASCTTSSLDLLHPWAGNSVRPLRPVTSIDHSAAFELV